MRRSEGVVCVVVVQGFIVASKRQSVVWCGVVCSGLVRGLVSWAVFPLWLDGPC